MVSLSVGRGAGGGGLSRRCCSLRSARAAADCFRALSRASGGSSFATVVGCHFPPRFAGMSPHSLARAQMARMLSPSSSRHGFIRSAIAFSRSSAASQ